MEIFYIKQGDTSPALRATLNDPAGVAVDLSGAAVVFSMKTVSGTLLVDRQTCSIITAASGIVEYSWQAGDTDVSGQHLSEFEVTFADSSVETFPNFDYLRIKISKELS